MPKDHADKYAHMLVPIHNILSLELSCIPLHITRVKLLPSLIHSPIPMPHSYADSYWIILQHATLKALGMYAECIWGQGRGGGVFQQTEYETSQADTLGQLINTIIYYPVTFNGIKVLCALKVGD